MTGPAPGEWRDIASAPRDGSELLLTRQFDGPGDWRIKVGGWSAELTKWHIYGASWMPTHWRPLPAPPQPARSDVEEGANG